MGAPFVLHWYVMGDLPVAATLNVAVFPAATVELAGCDVIAGATAVPDVTVRVTGTGYGELVQVYPP